MENEMQIKTFVRRRYSRDDLGHLGYWDTMLWTFDGLPHWVGPSNSPMIWEGEFIGEGRDEDVAYYLSPLFRQHADAIPSGCNHTSVVVHTVDDKALPSEIAKAVRIAVV
jgi:hypothetical protein